LGGIIKMKTFNETVVEDATLDWLRGPSCEFLSGPVILTGKLRMLVATGKLAEKVG